jgi:hypothetical protein
MPLTARLNTAVSSGLRTGCTAKICGWLQNGSIAREITVRPPIDRYCFGPPEPARSPRPAATIMAAVRFWFGIVICGEQSRGGTMRRLGWRTATGHITPVPGKQTIPDIIPISVGG